MKKLGMLKKHSKNKESMMRSKVLKALKESNERYLSGEELSQQIGVSRTSVWKHIKKTKKKKVMP